MPNTHLHQIKLDRFQRTAAKSAIKDGKLKIEDPNDPRSMLYAGLLDKLAVRGGLTFTGAEITILRKTVKSKINLERKNLAKVHPITDKTAKKVNTIVDLSLAIGGV
ncbi:MAG: hypothetical protein JKY33_10700 [Bacteroidia bacterium]|nr:hypothetical protein [Bacteroidia bacterium]